MMALMAGGGIVAVAGLWLMLWEGAGGASAKIAVGQLQIQASSAGFAVFLAGAAAFTAPIVAPDATERLLDRSVTVVTGQADPGAAARRSAGPMAREVAEMRDALARDREPQNDRMEGAVRLQVGELAAGTHGNGDSDWYRLDATGLTDRRIRVEIWEHAAGCHAHVYDGRATYLGLVSLVAGGNRLELEVSDNDSFRVELGCLKTVPGTPYQLRFTLRGE